MEDPSPGLTGSIETLSQFKGRSKMLNTEESQDQNGQMTPYQNALDIKNFDQVQNM